MRWKWSITSFLLTFTIAVFLPQRVPVADWIWPSFNHAEAADMLGRRVRYRRTEKFNGYKCPVDGYCRRIVDGEQGVVIGLEPVADGGYFLKVRWNQPGDRGNYVSYFGRYTRRESLERE